ncbi:MAG: hypothetical protein CME06_16820 [Gemmatimonadetes bacterium]|nr:hypothetical protein [Gemmatimonadota bacterium]
MFRTFISALALAGCIASTASAETPFLWNPGEYQVTILSSAHEGSGDIGWYIPPTHKLNQGYPTVHGTGTMRKLFTQGWQIGDVATFSSGWSSYCFRFGVYCEATASGDFWGGSHINTAHGSLYPGDPYYLVTPIASDTWRIDFEWWEGGLLDDLSVEITKIGACP